MDDNVRVLGYDTKVYKDQCVYCYNTAVVAPLYIDLYNFWAYCITHVKARGSQNAVYLKHVREVHEVSDEGQPAPKVTRLGIGVEGGFKSDKYEYEDKYTLLSTKTDGTHTEMELEAGTEKVRNTVQQVIARSSAATEEQNAQWDGEVRKDSKHSNTLMQLDNGVKVPPGPWKCSVEGCEKVDNLWMNLTCGTIFCGRRYYDGTGGNNHAIDYYDKNKYPLAVKLGTITPQGADVFSYDEDDMVVDTQLAKHMAHFGINIMECEKTEKTMNELEIDANQNLKFEYDNILESGVSLKPLYGPGYLGLINLGNTCYMNSLLQVLINCVDKFATRYQSYSNPSAEVPSDFCEQFKHLAYYMNNPGHYSINPEGLKPGHENGVRPVLLKSIIGRGHPEFSSSRQQDTHEYFLHLISLLEKEERKHPDLKCTDELVFEVEDRVQCDTSKQLLYTTRQEYCLSLPVPLDKASNVSAVEEWEIKKAALEKAGEKIKPEDVVKLKLDFQDCINTLTQPETIADFLSPATNSKTTANKKCGFKTFPNYLMVQIRRYTLTENWQPKKLDVLVNVPDEIDLSCLRSSGLQPGEVAMPVSVTLPEEPLQPDPTIVEQLMMMGFSLEACQKGAYHTKNSGAEPAMEWVLSHMDDPTLNDPLIIEQPKSSQINVSQENIEMLCAMGFTDKQARKALQKCDNNLERAADWVFSHAHELDTEDEPSEGARQILPDGCGKYKLCGFISHMGTSTACGHYVCHIRDKTGQWVLYNDEKVAASVVPPRDMGYMYLFKRIE